MVRSIRALQAATDDELIEEHDRIAQSTVSGTAYFLDELNRRASERAANESHRLAVAAFWLTVTTTVLSVLALAVAIIALVK